jgi:hypothetical protein
MLTGKVYFPVAHGWIARMKDDLSYLAEPLRHVTMEPNYTWHDDRAAHGCSSSHLSNSAFSVIHQDR